MRHTFLVLVENRFGELDRLAGHFAARGVNIDTLAAAETLDPTATWMTITFTSDDETAVELARELEPGVLVLKAPGFTNELFVQREVALIRVRAADQDAEKQLHHLLREFQGKIVADLDGEMIIEFTDTTSILDQILESLSPLGITELARGGAVTLPRSGIATLRGAAAVIG
ncbi:MAG: acetolactate synthase small subunit [Blastocatellia bacterium]